MKITFQKKVTNIEDSKEYPTYGIYVYVCVYTLSLKKGKKQQRGGVENTLKARKLFSKKTKKDLKLHSVKALVSGELENLYNADFRGNNAKPMRSHDCEALSHLSL